MSTILIVDDNAGHRGNIAEILMAAGHEVYEADCGMDGVRAAAKLMPDMVIMDILMPGMDGWEAAGELRQVEGLEDVPVIFCSGSYEDEMKFASSPLRKSAFITKPLGVEKLLGMVGHYAGVRGGGGQVSSTLPEAVTMQSGHRQSS